MVLKCLIFFVGIKFFLTKTLVLLEKMHIGKMMTMGNRNYNVIIIGAGIGGLVCGCHLAKAGKKVLIVERTLTPGGYCKSFKKEGLPFDTCVHSLESLRPEGYLGQLFQDLKIPRQDILRNNPCNTVITPQHKIFIWNDL